MKILFALFAAILNAFTAGAAINKHMAPNSGKLLIEASAGLPVTVINVTFRVGSADDPKGQEGLASLTGDALRQGGVKAWESLPARTRAELEDVLFPYAADIGVSVHKEQTAFRVATSATDAPIVFALLEQMILSPAFDPGEIDRLKTEALDALEKQLPREDEEELGKAALEQAMYGKAHPYAHAGEGTVAAVKKLDAQAVKGFYARHFTRARVTVGLSGVVDEPLRAEAKKFLARLPAGKTATAAVPPAPKPQMELVIVKGPFEAVGVHLGLPTGVTRASKDFPALYLTATGFGKHRSFVGRLMRVVREVRGLNYGTYSYAEEFPGGGHALIEPTQAARSEQAFTLWGRPTPVENGCFLLRQMYREVDSLAKHGLTPDELALAKGHLKGYVPLLAMGLDRRLGYGIDSRFYGIRGDYLKGLENGVSKASAADVKKAIARHIRPDQMKIVVVTPDPERFQKEILSESCDIHYPAGIEKPAEVLAEDKLIARTKVPVAKDRIRVVTSDAVFAD